MIVHLKQDAKLIDTVTSHRFVWEAGQHSVEDELAKRLLVKYPALFEEVAGVEGVVLTPNPNYTPAPVQAPEGYVCDACGKLVASALALAGHKRTHSKPISTADLLPKR